MIGIFASNAFAFEPSYTNYFSNPEFRIYKIQEKAYEFSIPYKISNAELDKIDIDCDSTELIVYLDKVEVDGNFIVNIPRTLLDMKINDKDYEFIVIIDNLETEYQETYTDLDSRTLDISLRSDSKILEIIATNTDMFPEPIPCAIGSSDESSYYRLMSPLKQFDSGITFNEIQCKENLVLIQKYDGSPACVTEQTKQKLIERGYAIYTEFSINSTGVGYDDSITHLSFEVAKDNMIFDVSYAIKGGIVEDMIFSKNTNSLLVKIDSTDKGNLTLGMPRNLLDAKFDYCIPIKSNPTDDTFIVLLDGEEIAYDEIATTNESRTLQIPFLENSTKIEVVATCLI